MFFANFKLSCKFYNKNDRRINIKTYLYFSITTLSKNLGKLGKIVYNLVNLKLYFFTDYVGSAFCRWHN